MTDRNVLLTKKQIELVENSWGYALTNGNQPMMVFYERLFELDQSVKHLFDEDTAKQSKKLQAMITFIVHKLNNLDEVLTDIEDLGRRHKNYKVKPEYYQTVGAALIWTLEKSLGNRWNMETRDAWLTVFGMLSDIMIKA